MPPAPSAELETPGSRRGAPTQVHAATLRCEVCGAETPHRVLKLDPGASARHLSGTARCQKCRTTHRFEVRAPRLVSVRLILSDGAESRSEEHGYRVGTVLKVGEKLPEIEPEAIIRRIDRPDGHMVPSAEVGEVGAVWATLHVGARVPVSLVEGARTTSYRVEMPPETRLVVGDPITVEGQRLYISALRARQRTWGAPGDGFPASRVERVYARRTRNPPAGSIDWRIPRESPRSRARATSEAGRSRSSPGSSTTRSSPRARSDSGGAAAHRSSPS